MYIYRLKEITPFVIGVKSYGIYIYITDKYYAVSYWRKIFKYIQHRLSQITPLVSGVKSFRLKMYRLN